MSKSDPASQKVQVSTLRLRKKLEDLANPVPRRSTAVAPQAKIKKEQERPKPILRSVPKESTLETKPTPIAPLPEKLEVPSPPDNFSPDKTEEITPKKVKSSKFSLWNYLPTLLILAEIGGVLLLLVLGIINLIEPNLSAKLLLSCQGKVAGKWQTRWGTLDFTETNDGLVKGKFDYKNVDRGLVKGELTGKLDGVALKFSWQETYTNKSKQSGNGVFIFGENCQEFYGNTGAVGSWQGRRMTAVPKAPSKPPSKP